MTTYLDTSDHAITDLGNTPGTLASPLLTRAQLDSATPSQAIAGAALVLKADRRLDRTGKPYAALVLRGGDGAVFDARWWQLAGPCPEAGSVFAFTGSVDTYNGVRQLRVHEAHSLPEMPLALFARATRRSREELCAELEDLLSLLDPVCLALARKLLSGSVWDRYCVWPAAQLHHAAVRHGLLAHSIGVARLALAISTAYGEALPHDRSLVLTAALLHDIGKTQTLPPIAGAPLPELASHLDHVTLGILMVRTASAQADPPLPSERLQLLLHTLLAHHGRREWGAPVEPQTPEAWLVHLADLAESRLWTWADQEE